MEYDSRGHDCLENLPQRKAPPGATAHRWDEAAPLRAKAGFQYYWEVEHLKTPEDECSPRWDATCWVLSLHRTGRGRVNRSAPQGDVLPLLRGSHAVPEHFEGKTSSTQPELRQSSLRVSVLEKSTWHRLFCILSRDGFSVARVRMEKE